MNKAHRSVYSLNQLLPVAGQGGFAVGSFSPRFTGLIGAVLQAAEATQSPVIVQVSQLELKWYQISLEEFARQFWLQFDRLQPTVPVGLHLDHSSDFALFQTAVANGFSSVMVDASALPLEKNIAETRRVIALAHAHGVSVEAELGRIGSADLVETESDEELFTDPQEAAYFVEQTGIDALAVSVGTAHGVYRVRQPRIDLERLKAIRALTPVPLVLHGGSGTPLEMIRNAIRLPGGGVSKVNFATELELAFLLELGLAERRSESVTRSYPAGSLERGVQAVRHVVEDKIVNFLSSRGRGADYLKG
jgi:fructose-bisphosphate aldolase class II